MAAPQGWLSELENARQTHVQADTVFRLCQALDISADYLMGLSDEPHPTRRRLRQPPEGNEHVLHAVPAVVRHQAMPLVFGVWKDKVPPDFDAHFDDLDEELISLFEGEDEANASAR
jgi:transcriptional regulator with XRE-family HTH domain